MKSLAMTNISLTNDEIRSLSPFAIEKAWNIAAEAEIQKPR
jgi:hypothetical protein